MIKLFYFILLFFETKLELYKIIMNFSFIIYIFLLVINLIQVIFIINNFILFYWGLGIGDWGLGFGEW